MSEGNTSWRLHLFKAGVGILLADAVLYVVARVIVLNLTPLNTELRAGAWFFVIGSLAALVASILIPFGYGWKRLPLVLACLVALPFWYGFTIY
jgi:hypothetical protein